MMTFLGYVIDALPVIGALAIVASANVRRSVRVHQSFMPAAAVLYAIVALFILYRYNDAIQSIGGENQTLRQHGCVSASAALFALAKAERDAQSGFVARDTFDMAANAYWLKM